ncbi:MAG: hypothetical protein AVDCRST_MAG54-3024 [uncultured Actinomycetospora sp.]|uniref:Uncharacterized protein n=1 Tax=uncultured Actinomycetospora sp. TaxID=1135996 RepID=A0A6J4J9E9_9PSEU|nr:MAG: hypothetical protein AVDCRST_MAG54-3024 [uncultured Actinomycetospora sp.]
MAGRRVVPSWSDHGPIPATRDARDGRGAPNVVGRHGTVEQTGAPPPWH